MWNAASNFHLALTIAQEAYLFYEIISGFIYAQADLSAVSLYWSVFTSATCAYLLLYTRESLTLRTKIRECKRHMLVRMMRWNKTGAPLDDDSGNKKEPSASFDIRVRQTLLKIMMLVMWKNPVLLWISMVIRKTQVLLQMLLMEKRKEWNALSDASDEKEPGAPLANNTEKESDAPLATTSAKTTATDELESFYYCNGQCDRWQ